MKKTCILILLFFFLWVGTSVSNVIVFATDGMDDIDDVDFVGLSPEKMQIIYDRMTDPENVYSSPIYHYDNFMESYFDNLTINHGANTLGSCGYVGIDMLLSYYDTYLNDNILPEQYDKISEGGCYNVICRRNSPGSLFDEPDGFEEIYNEDDEDEMSTAELRVRNTEYYNYIKQQKDVSLHAKLVTIGHNLGFYDYFSTSPAGTSHYNVKQVIKKYMSDVVGFDKGDEYTIDDIKNNLNNDSDDVRNFVIQKVCSGIPVLVSLEDEEGEGHWVVAYDYDAATDKIFCNFGWGSDATHITPENWIEELGYTNPKLKNYYIYDTALTIEFNIPHVHSNNYAVTTTIDGEKVTNYYCYDSSEIEVYDIDFTISQPNPNSHKIVYECGDVYTGEHKYNDHSPYNDSKHRQECIVCEKEKLTSHIINCESNNGITHNLNCIVCSYNKTEIHDFVCDGSIGAIHYEKCLDCQYRTIQITKFQFENINEYSHTKHCVTCNYRITDNHNLKYGIESSTHHKYYCVDCSYVESSGRHVLELVGGDNKQKKCITCGAMVFIGGNDIFPIQSKPPKDPEEETE